MTDISRDDAPEAFSLTRRNLVVGAAVFAGTMLSSDGGAQISGSPAPTIATKFMEASSLLVNHHLDAEVGARMSVAMLHMNPGIDQDIGAILKIAKQKNAKIVEDFFPDIPEGRLKNTALAIISAWYTGVVDNTSPHAEVFAFETALMYQPTHDVMTIPSYAISGPNGWNAEAPPLSHMPTF